MHLNGNIWRIYKVETRNISCFPQSKLLIQIQKPDTAYIYSDTVTGKGNSNYRSSTANLKKNHPLEWLNDGQ